MNIKEFLEEIKADEHTVMARFANNEGLYDRFAKKFLQDLSYKNTVEAADSKNYEVLEAQAHTLKGVAANLGFDMLSAVSAKLVNAVREKKYEQIDGILPEFEEEYKKITDAIGKLD